MAMGTPMHVMGANLYVLFKLQSVYWVFICCSSWHSYDGRAILNIYMS
jgi:hypothetical protein